MFFLEHDSLWRRVYQSSPFLMKTMMATMNHIAMNSRSTFHPLYSIISLSQTNMKIKEEKWRR